MGYFPYSLGAGQGRLLPYVTHNAGRVFAYEPDRLRFTEAERLKDFNKLTNVTLRNKTFTKMDLSEENPTTIFCGYVIQHIGDESTKNLIREMHQVLDPQGNLVLLTNFSQLPNDFFTFLARRGEIVEEPNIVQADFEQLVKEGKNDYLPIRYFSLRTIRFLLKDFDIKFVRTFHDPTPKKWFDESFFRDDIFNKIFLQKNFGRHIAVVAKPKK